ncbi:MAG: DUF2950 family protein [Planctomycetota bacterium]
MRRGFTLIELMILVALLAVIAAIAISSLITSRMASNEAHAIGSLRAYLCAQNLFRRKDSYGIGALVYANPSSTQGVGNEYPDLYQISYKGGATGTRLILGMIDKTFADACIDFTTTKPMAGYQYDSLEGFGGTNFDYSVDCGLCAAPKSYNRSGRNTFIIDVAGAVYQRDSAQISTYATGDEVTPMSRPLRESFTEWLVLSPGI